MSKPKYNIGDKVWLIQKDQIKKRMITGVFLAEEVPGTMGIALRKYVYLVGRYRHRDIVWWMSDKDKQFYSKELFSTKAELIKAINKEPDSTFA
jgi:transposase InsO family protein